ncbi:hypothetical protein [uncultured Nostoc sp.]|uniref:hypothetical protein n=1 Tax=uncultured Nostoc sp. TaxID=340711 RepID=UPI0035CA4267
MFGVNRETQYQSSLGTVVVVPRPTLASLNTDKLGKPQSVQLGGSWTIFDTILGIRVADYKSRKPTLVVYRLADGTLLAATKAVIEASEIAKTSQYHGQCYITPVSALKVLDALPEDINPIDLSSFVFETSPI